MKKDLISAVAYCRVSTKSTDQKNSYDAQIKFFREKAEELGYELVKGIGTFGDGIFADRGISGKALTKRIEFKKLTEQVKTLKFKAILVTNASRLARNAVDGMNVIREIKPYDAYIHFLKENLKSCNHSDEFLIDFFMMFSQNELREMSKKIQDGVRKAQGKGVWTAPPPYGYNRLNGYLQINEEEKQVVELMFFLYAEIGYSIDKLVRELNGICIPTKKEKKWQHTTIRHIIENPIYTGLQINHQTEMKDIFINLIEKINEHGQIRNYFEHLQIIDKEIFIKAQEIKKERSQMVENGKKYSSTNVLSNIFFCKYCNASMKRMQRSDKKGQFYYVCSNCHKDRAICKYYNYIKGEEAFDKIMKDVKSFAENIKGRTNLKELYQFYIDKYLNKNFVNKLPEIESEIERLENRKKNYQIMKADGELSKNDFSDRMNEVESELKNLYRNRDKILNIEKEIENIWDIYNYLISTIQNFDIRKSSNGDIKKIITKVEIKTVDNEKLIEVQLNNGLEKDFSTISNEYNMQFIDF